MPYDRQTARGDEAPNKSFEHIGARPVDVMQNVHCLEVLQQPLAVPFRCRLVVTSTCVKKSAPFEILLAQAPYDLSEQRSLVLLVLLHNHVD
jgi:hypothetical protein